MFFKKLLTVLVAMFLFATSITSAQPKAESSKIIEPWLALLIFLVALFMCVIVVIFLFTRGKIGKRKVVNIPIPTLFVAEARNTNEGKVHLFVNGRVVFEGDFPLTEKGKESLIQLVEGINKIK